MVGNPKKNHIRAYKLKDVFETWQNRVPWFRQKEQKQQRGQNLLSISIAKIHGWIPGNRTISAFYKADITIYLKFTFHGIKNTRNSKKRQNVLSQTI
jgi:hypothetical protein